MPSSNEGVEGREKLRTSPQSAAIPDEFILQSRSSQMQMDMSRAQIDMQAAWLYPRQSEREMLEPQAFTEKTSLTGCEHPMPPSDGRAESTEKIGTGPQSAAHADEPIFQSRLSQIEVNTSGAQPSQTNTKTPRMHQRLSEKENLPAQTPASRVCPTPSSGHFAGLGPSGGSLDGYGERVQGKHGFDCWEDTTSLRKTDKSCIDCSFSPPQGERIKSEGGVDRPSAFHQASGMMNDGCVDVVLAQFYKTREESCISSTPVLPKCDGNTKEIGAHRNPILPRRDEVIDDQYDDRTPTLAERAGIRKDGCMYLTPVLPHRDGRTYESSFDRTSKLPENNGMGSEGGAHGTPAVIQHDQMKKDTLEDHTPLPPQRDGTLDSGTKHTCALARPNERRNGLAMLMESARAAWKQQRMTVTPPLAPGPEGPRDAFDALMKAATVKTNKSETPRGQTPARKGGRGGRGSEGGRGWGRGASRAPLPSFKRVEGTRLIVDGFRGQPDSSLLYFLTHFHADHYIGLSRAPSPQTRLSTAPPVPCDCSDQFSLHPCPPIKPSHTSLALYPL